MNCIILLLLLCCCNGCENGVSGNSNGNCCCEHNHCNHHHNPYNRERRECVYVEKPVCETVCDCCAEQESCEVAGKMPPSWQDFRGMTRDCDCKK